MEAPKSKAATAPTPAPKPGKAPEAPKPVQPQPQAKPGQKPAAKPAVTPAKPSAAKSGSGTWIGVLVVLIVLAVIGVVYKQSNKSQPPTPVAAPAPQVDPKQVEIDKLLAEAKNNLDNKFFAKAVETYDKVLVLAPGHSAATAAPRTGQSRGKRPHRAGRRQESDPAKAAR